MVGRLGRTHGVRGEIFADVLTDFPERFAAGESLLVGRERGRPPSSMEILSVRPHAGRLLLHFEGIQNREEAQNLTGLKLMVRSEDALPLDEDTYYPHQLIGLQVHNMDGEDLGKVSELMETGAADVLILRDEEGRTRLVPMIAEVIREVDLNAGTISIDPLPGLFD